MSLTESQRKAVEENFISITNRLKPFIADCCINLNCIPMDTKERILNDYKTNNAAAATVMLINAIQAVDHGWTKLIDLFRNYLKMPDFAQFLETRAEQIVMEDTIISPKQRSADSLAALQKQLSNYIEWQCENINQFWKDFLPKTKLSEAYCDLEVVSAPTTLKGNRLANNDYTLLFDGRLGERIIVEGDAGIGKTTFLNRIALDWATASGDSFLKQKFQCVLTVPVKLLHNERLIEALVNTVKYDNARDLLHQLLLSAETNARILLLVDGLDEIDWIESGGGTDDLMALFAAEYRKRFLHHCTVVVATRPSHIDRIDSKDKWFRILGFTEQHSSTFIAKQLGYKAKPVALPVNILRIPLMCAIYCAVCNAVPELDNSDIDMFDIIDAFVKHICGLHAESRPQAEHYTVDKLLMELGAYTYELLRSNVKSTLCRAFGLQLSSHTPEELLNVAADIGLFYKRKRRSVLDRNYVTVLEPIHILFVEYMAAYFIVNSVPQDKCAELITLLLECLDTDSQILFFASGLSMAIFNATISRCCAISHDGTQFKFYPRDTQMPCEERYSSDTVYLPFQLPKTALKKWLFARFNTAEAANVTVGPPADHNVLRPFLQLTKPAHIYVKYFENFGYSNSDVRSVFQAFPDSVTDCSVDECFTSCEIVEPFTSFTTIPATIRYRFVNCLHENNTSTNDGLPLHYSKSITIMFTEEARVVCRLPNVKRLSIRREASLEVVEQLMKSIVANDIRLQLRKLILQGNHVAGTSIHVAESLRHLQSLIYFDMSDCNITTNVAAMLANTLSTYMIGSVLQILNLENNPCIGSIATIVSTLTQLHQLTWLCLDDCGLDSSTLINMETAIISDRQFKKLIFLSIVGNAKESIEHIFMKTQMEYQCCIIVPTDEAALGWVSKYNRKALLSNFLQDENEKAIAEKVYKIVCSENAAQVAAWLHEIPQSTIDQQHSILFNLLMVHYAIMVSEKYFADVTIQQLLMALIRMTFPYVPTTIRQRRIIVAQMFDTMKQFATNENMFSTILDCLFHAFILPNNIPIACESYLDTMLFMIENTNAHQNKIQVRMLEVLDSNLAAFPHYEELQAAVVECCLFARTLKLLQNFLVEAENAPNDNGESAHHVSLMWSIMWRAEIPSRTVEFCKKNGWNLLLSYVKMFPTSTDIRSEMAGMLSDMIEKSPSVTELFQIIPEDAVMLFYSWLSDKAFGVEIGWSVAQILLHMLCEISDSRWPCNYPSQNDVIEKIYNTVNTWSVHSKRTVGMKSFNDIIKLLHKAPGNPAAIVWVLWTISNFIIAGDPDQSATTYIRIGIEEDIVQKMEELQEKQRLLFESHPEITMLAETISSIAKK